MPAMSEIPRPNATLLESHAMKSTLFALSLSLLVVASPCSGLNAAEKQPPNIVLLVSDDQRFDTLGCMGNEIIQTPHIDALAAEGTLFRNAFCTTSICATSRATILNGQYARRHGIWSFRQMLSAEEFANSFPMQLKEHGYHLGFIGKWGVGGGNTMPADKYDYWRGFAGQGQYFVKGRAHMTRFLGDQTQEFFDDYQAKDTSAKKPFCLHVAFKAAHCQDGDGWQFRHAEKYKDLYAEVTIPPQPTATDKHYAALPKPLQESEGRVRWHRRFDGEEMYQKNIKDYYRLLTGVDEIVGEIVARLKKDGQYDNTVIIYTSDHGFYLGDRGLAGKWFMHEESIRMPLVIFDPRVEKTQRGKSREELALLVDIAPTILDLAGIELPQSMQGSSLAPLTAGKSPTWRDDFLYEHLFKHGRIPMNDGVRGMRWKYCRYYFGDDLHEELYDLRADPLEEKNLASDQKYRETLDQYRARYRELVDANK